MPIDLHERLSEFSYGYGVTREIERQLRSQGLAATPFLPSLLHEASLGFDVAFKRPGTPLLIQFKLGQAMRRFVPAPRPKLSKQFWRYQIDAAEPDGQFELLLKAEQDGADVFYLAPKFHDWENYLKAFERKRVLQKSLIVTPSTIRQTLVTHGVPDGLHKIVYDNRKAYLCSEPIELDTFEESGLANKLRVRIADRKTSIAQVLEQVFEGFAERAMVRRRPDTESDDDSRIGYAIPSDDGTQAGLRFERLSRIRASGRSSEEAIAIAVGAEAWAAGAQLVFVTEPD